MKTKNCIKCNKNIKGTGKTGLCSSCISKQRYEKGNHPFIKLIGKHSYNYKGINKKCKCIDCGKKISKPTYYRGKRCRSCESKRRIRLNIAGYQRENMSMENNPNWQNGKSFEPYSIDWTNELKQSIRQRDNYTCQNCDMTEEEHLIVYGKVLTVHHIDYNKKNCNKNNLLSLCNQCNSRVNFNRDYWFEFFTKKIESVIR